MPVSKTTYVKKVPPTVFGLETDKDGFNTPTAEQAKFAAKQGFKAQCDINTIVDQAKRTGVLSHTAKNAAFYADMPDFDYEDAMIQIAETNSVFYELDAETRREFSNNPGQFRAWLQGKTSTEIQEALPQLFEQGTQLVDTQGGTTAPAIAQEVIKALGIEPSSPEGSPAKSGDESKAKSSEKSSE